MPWIILIVVAYFFISLTALTDKFLLTKALPNPVVYVFFISVLGLAAGILIPFGFYVPVVEDILISCLAGAFFTGAIYFLFQALQHGETSRVFATSGALSAFFTFIFSYLFLGERLGRPEVIGFGLLVFGGVLMSLELGVKKKNARQWLVIVAALFFGVSYTATKLTYEVQGFISGFVWIRLFAFLVALLFLIDRNNRAAIFGSLTKESKFLKRGSQFILIGGQASSAIGFLILNYAISIASATIILAAQGLQYFFLFLVASILSVWYPHVIKERIRPGTVIQKITAIVIIFIGLYIIGLNQA